MFQVVLPIRPVSSQKKGSKEKYKKRIIDLIEKKGYIKKPYLSGELYARILWLHSIKRVGDVDNIIKPILDSLKDNVYQDDNIINACAVKAMGISNFILPSKFLNDDIFNDFIDVLNESHDHIIYIEVDTLNHKKPFLGPIDGGYNE